MSVPGIVQSSLDGEQVAAQVPLGGEDALFVTPTRTLIYRADGLLSNESVDEYSHEAERIGVSEGRRKATVSLDYGIEGEEEFTLPSRRLQEALHPVLAGVLNAADVTNANETVKQTYLFSELTLVVTGERVIKHVGEAVWEQDFEEFHYGDVTSLEVEEGNVSSQIIIESDGRPQRVKTPSDRTREVRERVERALLSYHDVATYEEFATEVAGDDEPDAESGGEETEEISLGTDGSDRDAVGDDDSGRTTADGSALDEGGVDPIEANPPELDDDGSVVERPDAGRGDAEAGPLGGTDAGFADSGFESASSELRTDATEERLEALTEAVERQNELLEEQQRTLERLVRGLTRDQ